MSSPIFDRVLFEATPLAGGWFGALVAKREAPIVSPIPGEDLKFLYANVHPRGETGETVIVSSPEVPAPVAVRYGWADYPL